MQIFKILMVSFFITLPSTSCNDGNENDLFKTIQAQNDLYERYYNSDDVDALTKLHTEDATVIAPNFGPARGHEEIRVGLAEELAMGDGRIDFETLEVTSLTKDTAYEIGHYKLRIDLEEGEPFVDEGDYVIIWKLCEDDVWRIHVDIWNTSLPLE